MTVTYDRQRLDLSLPAHAPVADLLPELMRLAATPARQPSAANIYPSAAATRWVLAPIGAPPLADDTTLADAGIHDGAVIGLYRAHDAPPPARLEHLLDVVVDHVDHRSGRWSRRTTIELTAVTIAVLTLAALIVLPAMHTTAAATAGTAVATALALLTAAVITAPHRGANRDTARPAAPLGSAVLLTAAAATAAWGATAALLPRLHRESLPSAPAGLAIAAVAALAAIATRAAGRTLDGPALMLIAVAMPAIAAWQLQPARGPAAVAVAGVLILGTLPRISAGAGGIAAVDYRLRAAGRVPADQVTAAVDRSSHLLAWLLAGHATAAAIAAIVCATATGPRAIWFRLLAACVGLALLARSRMFTRTGHVLPVRLAGLATLAATGLAVSAPATESAQRLALAGLALAGILAATVASADLRPSTIARSRQIVTIIEAAAVTAAVPLLAAALGLFDIVHSALADR